MGFPAFSPTLHSRSLLQTLYRQHHNQIPWRLKTFASSVHLHSSEKQALPDCITATPRDTVAPAYPYSLAAPRPPLYIKYTRLWISNILKLNIQGLGSLELSCTACIMGTDIQLSLKLISRETTKSPGRLWLSQSGHLSESLQHPESLRSAQLAQATPHPTYTFFAQEHAGRKKIKGTTPERRLISETAGEGLIWSEICFQVTYLFHPCSAAQISHAATLQQNDCSHWPAPSHLPQHLTPGINGCKSLIFSSSDKTSIVIGMKPSNSFLKLFIILGWFS